MTDSDSSNIIQQTTLLTLQGKTAQCLHFRDDKILVLTENALAFYQNKAAINNELGTGLIAMAELSTEHHFTPSSQGWVHEYKAGYVGLNDDRAILITPLAIQLFPNKTDALYNRHEIARLDIPA